MDKSEILKRVDHTILTQTCTWGEVKEICDDAIRYNTASICIPPSFVKANIPFYNYDAILYIFFQITLSNFFKSKSFFILRGRI